MPLRKRKVLVKAGMAGIVALSGLSLFQWCGLQGWISHTVKIENAYTECLSALFDVEDGRRSYVLNADLQSKSRYTSAKKRVDDIVAHLIKLTDDNQYQQERLQKLKVALAALFEAFDKLLEVRDKQGFDAAVVLVRQSNGYADIVHTIRALLTQGLEDESNLLEVRTQTALFWQWISIGTTALLAVTSFVFLSQVLQLLGREKQAEQLKYESLMSRQREDFMAALAHNLKLPMIGMKHIFEGFLRGSVGNLDDTQKHMFQALMSANDEQMVLIDRLLDIYKYQESGAYEQRADVELSELICECLQKFSKRAAEGKVELISDLTPMQLTCDRAAMQILVSNLVDNALTHTPEGGSVTVSLSRNHNYSTLEVKDTGSGFDSKHKEMMFDSFWKGPADSQFAPNIGLGLYLCRQIAEAHGGKVSCDSEPGKGASFFVTFPLVSNHSNKGA